MTKKNFDENIKGPTGEIVLEKDAPIQMRITLVNILGADPTQSAKTAVEKMQRGQLAAKLLVGGDVELSIEEMALIKQCVGEACPPFVVKQVWDLIEK